MNHSTSDQNRSLQTHEQVDNNQTPQEPDVEQLHAAIARERSEPREGFQPIPVPLIVSLFGLLMWGGWYLGQYDADFTPQRLDGPAAFATQIQSASSEPAKLDPLIVGKRVFNNCVSCHQTNGNGSVTYPPINKSDWVNGRPEVFAAILLRGINGPFEVNGRTYNNEMPSWGSKLTDFEIAAVMTYVRSSWDNNASPVDESLVKRIRGDLSRSGPWTQESLIEFRDSLPAETSNVEPEAESGKPVSNEQESVNK